MLPCEAKGLLKAGARIDFWWLGWLLGLGCGGAGVALAQAPTWSWSLYDAAGVRVGDYPSREAAVEGIEGLADTNGTKTYRHVKHRKGPAAVDGMVAELYWAGRRPKERWDYIAGHTAGVAWRDNEATVAAEMLAWLQARHPDAPGCPAKPTVRPAGGWEAQVSSPGGVSVYESRRYQGAWSQLAGGTECKRLHMSMRMERRRCSVSDRLTYWSDEENACVNEGEIAYVVHPPSRV